MVARKRVASWVGPMTRFQDILRKLAIIDEGFVEDGAGLGLGPAGTTALDARTVALLRLGALVAIGSSTIPVACAPGAYSDGNGAWWFGDDTSGYCKPRNSADDPRARRTQDARGRRDVRCRRPQEGRQGTSPTATSAP
jgi:hypothetical protein